MIDTKALRSRVLDLAIQGKLTEQLESDGTAEELYQQILAEKQKLISEGKHKKEKPLPPIKPGEIPFEIPENWMWLRHNDLFELSGGSQPSKAEFINEPKEGYIRLYQIRDYGNNPVPVYIPMTYASKTTRKGDVLLARYGASLGKVFIAEEGAYNVAMAKVVSLFESTLIDKNYLFWYYRSKLYQNAIMMMSRSAQSGFNKDDLNSLLFLLPPLAEQKRIVERVEEIFRLLDAIDEAQEKYSADAESLKAKLITAGIQGKLTEQLPSDGTAEELYQQIQVEKQRLIKEGKIKKEKPLPAIKDEEIPFEIPGNWKWVRLSELTVKITSGSTPAGGKKGNAYVNEGYCFFREQNIYNDGIHTDGMVYISEELLKTRENSTVLPNDILLNITGGSIGRCAIIPDDFSKGSINQHILIIRLVEKEMLNYIHDLLCSPYYQGIIQSKVVGDKDGFSGGRCKATLIPLPPLAEQKRIAEVLERVLGALSLQ